MTAPQQKPKPEVPQPGSAIFWWIILIGLMVWNVAHLWPKPVPEISVPYTVFLDQIRAGNVAQVQILGDKITGSFVKPLAWPQKKQTPKPSAPSKTPAENVSSAAPSSYTKFDTMFPTAIGDPSLLSLLEKHKVIVDVRPPASP